MKRLALTVPFLLTPVLAHAAPVTYNINDLFSTFSVSGTITTDGNTGSLTSSDITGFNLTIQEPSVSLNLTTSNSQDATFGINVVSATATGLFVNYTLAGDLLFQSPGVGAGDNFICYQGSGRDCFGNGEVASEGVNIQGTTLFATQSGMVQIGSAAAVTPEPSSLMLLGTGIAGVVGMARRRLFS